MIECKKCDGFVYEDHPYTDAAGKKWVELVCSYCGKTKDLDLKKWTDFKQSIKGHDLIMKV